MLNVQCSRKEKEVRINWLERKTDKTGQYGQKRTFSVKSAKSGQNGHRGFELKGIFKNLQLLNLIPVWQSK
jgi:hypothetical protein